MVTEKVLLRKDDYLLSPQDCVSGLLKPNDEVTVVAGDALSSLASARDLSTRKQVKRIPSPYSAEETKLRIDLAAAYRIFHYYGWTDVIYNHLTVRLPEKEGDNGVHRFLINPFGLHFSEVTASSLITVDVDGNIVDQGTTQLGINKAGYVIHSAVHDHFPGLQCVMHCHDDNGVAVSNMKCGFLHKLDQNSMIVGEVAYHDYEGIALRKEERERLIKNLGTKQVMILKNHGLLTCGRSIAEAFILMHYLIKACSIQVASLAGGLDNLSYPSEESYLETRKIIKEASSIPTKNPGEADFAALVRLVEAQDDSFRDLL